MDDSTSREYIVEKIEKLNRESKEYDCLAKFALIAQILYLGSSYVISNGEELALDRTLKSGCMIFISVIESIFLFTKYNNNIEIDDYNYRIKKNPRYLVRNIRKAKKLSLRAQIMSLVSFFATVMIAMVCQSNIELSSLERLIENVFLSVGIYSSVDSFLDFYRYTRLENRALEEQRLMRLKRKKELYK